MDREAFLAKVEEYHRAGWRLALINAASVLAADEAEQSIEVTWAFAKDTDFEHMREKFHQGDSLPSISTIYGAAFLYENEIRELFGLNVEGINVDLRGQLYKTAEKVPFAPSAIRARLEKNAAAGIVGATVPAASAPAGHGAGHATAARPAAPAPAPAPAATPAPAKPEAQA